MWDDDEDEDDECLSLAELYGFDDEDDGFEAAYDDVLKANENFGD